MATFTSVTSGNWNDGATWGKTSPGVKGTDWPGNANDVVNIGTTAGQAHVVIYNVSEANALGAVTIGATSGVAQSRLEFATNMSTKLTLGQQDISIQKTGELRIGQSNSVLNKAYTAEIGWTLSADNTKGINIADGGKISLYGDPAYYSNDFDTSLYSAWNGSDATIYLTGDFSGKWVSGQELLIHKGGVYGTSGCVNDFALVSVNGTITYDGTKSTVPITIVHVPSAGSGFAAGGDVLNISRNIMLYPTGYSHNIGAFPSYRTRMANTSSAGTNNINIQDTQLSGWNVGITGYGNNTANIVGRNCYSFISNQRGGSNANIILAISNSPYGLINNSWGLSISGYFCASQYAVGYLWAKCNTPTGQTLKIFGNSRGITGYACNLVAYIYSNSVATGSQQAIGSENFIYRDSVIGYNQAGNSCPNATDLEFIYSSDIVFINTKFQTIPPTAADRNIKAYPGRFSFEHYNQVFGDHYICDAFGDINRVVADGSGDNPSQRTGGNANVIESLPQSLCSTTAWLELFNFRLWATAGVSKTYRFYVQTDFAALAKSALVLYGEYLDNNPAGTGHLATINTSGAGNFTTRANAADWSQYVEVTMNPAQTGYVNLYLWLMGYEATKKVWVDPMPVVSGKTYVCHWSMGAVVVTEAGGTGTPATQRGWCPWELNRGWCNDLCGLLQQCRHSGGRSHSDHRRLQKGLRRDGRDPGAHGF